ncbi:MAG: integrase [Solibacillus sp.]
MRKLMNGEIPLNFKTNPYDRTQWHDDVTDPVTGEVIEDGTPYMSEYANNFEWGIWNAYQFLNNMYRQLERMRVQMELDGRVPGNSGTFSDTLDGNTNKIILDTTLTDIIQPVAAGTTVLPVASVTGFTAFTQVTIFDDVSSEDVFITAIGADTITVQALVNSYKKGAKAARSNVAIDTVNAEMSIGDWNTYNVSLVEVV